MDLGDSYGADRELLSRIHREEDKSRGGDLRSHLEFHEEVAKKELGQADSPERMPEVMRELMATRGALDSVSARVAELTVKVQPVLRQQPRDILDQDRRAGAQNRPPVESDLGKALLDLQETMHDLEMFVHGVTEAVAL